MTTPTMDSATIGTGNPCGGLEGKDVLALPLSYGSHGNKFDGACCVIEKSNRLTVCVPELGRRFGVAKKFDDDHESIRRSVRRFLIRLNDGWLNRDGSLRMFAPADAQSIL